MSGSMKGSADTAEVLKYSEKRETSNVNMTFFSTYKEAQ